MQAFHVESDRIFLQQFRNSLFKQSEMTSVNSVKTGRLKIFSYLGRICVSLSVGTPSNESVISPTDCSRQLNEMSPSNKCKESMNKDKDKQRQTAKWFRQLHKISLKRRNSGRLHVTEQHIQSNSFVNVLKCG
jgi:hypothetical protein